MLLHISFIIFNLYLFILTITIISYQLILIPFIILYYLKKLL